MKPMRILVSRSTGGLGDQFMVSVAVRAAREKYSGDHLTFRTWEPCLPLFYDQGWCDDVIAGPGGGPFDYVLDLNDPEKRYETRCGWNIRKSRIQNFCETVDHVPNDQGNWKPHWRPSIREIRRGLSVLQREGLPTFGYVAIQWAAARGYKDVRPGIMAEVVSRLLAEKRQVLIIHDRPVPKEIDDKTFVLFRRPLREVGVFLFLAQMSITPDSGMLHFSAAVDTPNVAIFGPTDPRTTLAFYPLAMPIWYPERLAHYSCERPCWGQPRRGWPQDQCDHERSACMNVVRAEDIVRVMNEWANRQADAIAAKRREIGLDPQLAPIIANQVPADVADMLGTIPANCDQVRKPGAWAGRITG